MMAGAEWYAIKPYAWLGAFSVVLGCLGCVAVMTKRLLVAVVVCATLGQADDVIDFIPDCDMAAS